MTDSDTASGQTLRDRLTAAGLSEDRIAEHLAAGRITVDGEPVHDLDQPAGLPARMVIRGS